ncbi:MAG TPA: hypothetical protein VE172_03725 [Stackebrandtia sp.]|uniref:hypothetical protein n=1 Tax=Stackebrandtia sp. TaxID=2023065 RepID=UPI002D2A2AFD|nr:hypothetical protein [Stackebrandtia sp.]HZE37898.1 hypothetical protein [Stackebrandtia sp.]
MNGGEYDGLTIHDLHEIVSTYQPEAMGDQAQGFANAADVFKTLKENLDRHIKTIEGKLDSKAAKPFLDEIHKTRNVLNDAHELSTRKSAAWSEMAGIAQHNKDHVGKLYKEYKAAKGDASDKYDHELVKYAGNPSKYLLENGGTPTEPDNHAIRQHYDTKARNLMQSAIPDYAPHVGPAIAPPPPYKPLPVPNDPGWTPWPGTEKHWGKHGDGGSNATDTAGLTATSYGGNAAGAHNPLLQSGITAPVTSPGPSPMPTPTPGGGMPLPPTGLPVGGVPPLGKTPAPPVIKPSINSMTERPVPGRLGPTSRTPGLPSRSNATSRIARTARGGLPEENENLNGRFGRAGRGLVKSQMEPQDRTGLPRKSGEVMGRRAVPKSTPAVEEEAQTRATSRALRPVIRGVKATGRPAAADVEPMDNTTRGYSSRVIGAKPGRFTRAFSRTPLVAKKLEHGAGGKVFAKRPEPISAERQWAKKAIAERRARRAKLQAQSDGLSRPVIGNGITHPGQLDHPAPEVDNPEPESLWTSPATVPGIIGQRRPILDVGHDPGPGVITSRADADEESIEEAHDPGPTSFSDRRSQADTTNWPQ